MKIELSSGSENQISNLVLETDPSVALKECNNALKRISTNISVPGFRKGKAPSSLVIDHVGYQYIIGQVLNNSFLTDLIQEAVLQSGSILFDIITVDKLELPTFDSPIRLEAQIRLLPEAVISDYKNLQLDVEIEPLDLDQKIQEKINKLTRSFVTFEEASEHDCATHGDKLVIDFEGFTSEEANHEDANHEIVWNKNEQFCDKDYSYVIGEHQALDVLMKDIIGMKSGEEKTMIQAMADSFELTGSSLKFDVKVKQLFKHHLPDLTDEFIANNKDTFGATSLDELKGTIQKDIETEYNTLKENLKKDAVINKFLELSQVDIPNEFANLTAGYNLQRFMQKFNVNYDENIIHNLIQSENFQNNVDNARQALELRSCLFAVVKLENFEQEKSFEEKLQLAQDLIINSAQVNFVNHVHTEHCHHD